MKHIMKHQTLAIAFLSTAGFVVGCNKTETASQQIDKVEAKTREAAQDMKDYTFAQKAEFTAKMQSQLTALNHDLDQLGARIEKSSDAIKAGAKPKLDALRDQTAGLNKQLEEVKTPPKPPGTAPRTVSRKLMNRRRMVSNKPANGSAIKSRHEVTSPCDRNVVKPTNKQGAIFKNSKQS